MFSSLPLPPLLPLILEFPLRSSVPSVVAGVAFLRALRGYLILGLLELAASS